MRVSYEPTRTIWSAILGFCLVGPIPRLFGILQPKPEYVNFIKSMDATALTMLSIMSIYVIWAIVHNAREETKNVR